MIWWLTSALAILAAGGILDDALRYWGATYRLSEDGRLVRTGRVVAGPHWLVAPDRLSSIDTVSTWVDQLLGTTTVELVLEGESGEQGRTIRLPHLSEPGTKAVIETLVPSSPSDTVDRDDRALIDTSP